MEAETQLPQLGFIDRLKFLFGIPVKSSQFAGNYDKMVDEELDDNWIERFDQETIDLEHYWNYREYRRKTGYNNVMSHAQFIKEIMKGDPNILYGFTPERREEITPEFNKYLAYCKWVDAVYPIMRIEHYFVHVTVYQNYIPGMNTSHEGFYCRPTTCYMIKHEKTAKYKGDLGDMLSKEYEAEMNEFMEKERSSNP